MEDLAGLGVPRRVDAVMTPSRPNGVLNQGTPAYGYWPWGVALTSMRRSAAERRTHWLNRSLEVSIVA